MFISFYPLQTVLVEYMNMQYNLLQMHECDYVLVFYFYFVRFWYDIDNTEKLKVLLSSEMEKEKMM